jgi:hypothetical protein
MQEQHAFARNTSSLDAALPRTATLPDAGREEARRPSSGLFRPNQPDITRHRPVEGYDHLLVEDDLLCQVIVALITAGAVRNSTHERLVAPDNDLKGRHAPLAYRPPELRIGHLLNEARHRHDSLYNFGWQTGPKTSSALCSIQAQEGDIFFRRTFRFRFGQKGHASQRRPLPRSRRRLA